MFPKFQIVYRLLPLVKLFFIFQSVRRGGKELNMIFPHNSSREDALEFIRKTLILR
jgi:hypothetical protein